MKGENIITKNVLRNYVTTRKEEEEVLIHLIGTKSLYTPNFGQQHTTERVR